MTWRLSALAADVLEKLPQEPPHELSKFGVQGLDARYVARNNFQRV